MSTENNICKCSPGSFCNANCTYIWSDMNKKEVPKIVTDASGATKFDSDKPDMSLLSHHFIIEVTKVLDFGKRKYAAHNWRLGFNWTRPASASLRHIFAWIGGEDNDPESGLSHLAHAACCLMFLIEFIKTDNGNDDRYKGKK